MPINKDLPDKVFPMQEKWGDEPITRYLESINAIKVKCVQSPTRDQVTDYVASFCLATWEDRPRFNYTHDEKEQALSDLFDGKLLPNMYETIGFTFLISNIDLIDVTHLIRHRAFSFSAHCTGDSDQRNADCLVKPSILGSEYGRRFDRIVNMAKELYSDMVDSGEISLIDARTILPRSLANHYYARANLRDLIPYFKQRLDRQIQPETDNIIALRMLIEVAKVFPEIGRIISLDTPDWFYIKTAQEEHSSNMFPPEPKNDTFEWKPQWFVYPRTRAEMRGGQSFVQLWEKLSNEYSLLIAYDQERPE